jgi:hypothetical protein
MIPSRRWRMPIRSSPTANWTANMELLRGKGIEVLLA